jgi:hypothetical protein
MAFPVPHAAWQSTGVTHLVPYPNILHMITFIHSGWVPEQCWATFLYLRLPDLQGSPVLSLILTSFIWLPIYQVGSLNSVERLFLYLKLPGSRQGQDLDPLRQPLNPLGSRHLHAHTAFFTVNSTSTVMDPDSRVKNLNFCDNLNPFVSLVCFLFRKCGNIIPYSFVDG